LVDHRQSERRHREKDGEHDPADGQLERLGEEARVARAGLADREGHGLIGVEVDRDGAGEHVGLGVLRQRRRVELDRELLAEVLDRRAGEVDDERAVGAGHGLADDLAGVVLDGERHALDGGLGRLTAIADPAEDRDHVVVCGFGQLAGGRAVVVCCGRGHGCRREDGEEREYDGSQSDPETQGSYRHFPPFQRRRGVVVAGQ
jgi:hypothetical protein